MRMHMWGASNTIKTQYVLAQVRIRPRAMTILKAYNVMYNVMTLYMYNVIIINMHVHDVDCRRHCSKITIYM